jgi:transmembrane sensor
MTSSFDSIAMMLPGYFSNEISEEDRAIVETWRQESLDNERAFRELQKVWDAYPLLHKMEQYNALEALMKVHKRIHKNKSRHWISYLQRIAALLFMPLLLYSGYLTFKNHPSGKAVPTESMWQTITTPPGVKSCFVLPDSTKVWLNSSSSVTYPLSFTGDIRRVEVTGEAFFDVKEDQEHPFVAGLGKINVKVLGTRFNVINYEKENQVEVILESGNILLCQGTYNNEKTIADLKPGELAIYDKENNSYVIMAVQTDIYTSWINGKLIFKDESMDIVVRRLNHWFNVEIEVADKEILDYVYTATFQNESLDQILELLTISAPIRYRVIQREKEEEIFSAKRIILEKTKSKKKIINNQS